MQNRIRVDQHAAVSSSGEETHTTMIVTVDGRTTTVTTVSADGTWTTTRR